MNKAALVNCVHAGEDRVGAVAESRKLERQLFKLHFLGEGGRGNELERGVTRPIRKLTGSEYFRNVRRSDGAQRVDLPPKLLLRAGFVALLLLLLFGRNVLPSSWQATLAENVTPRAVTESAWIASGVLAVLAAGPVTALCFTRTRTQPDV